MEEEVTGDFIPSSADKETEAQAGKRSKGSDRAREGAGLRSGRQPCSDSRCATELLCDIVQAT